MSFTTLVSMSLICIAVVVMGTSVTASSYRRSNEIENEAHDIIMYDHLKRALLARLVRQNSVKRALADCSDNVRCMVWGKRAIVKNKNNYEQFSEQNGQDTKRALLAKLKKYNGVKRSLAADCSGNVKCMLWGKRTVMENKNNHKRFVSDFL